MRRTILLCGVIFLICSAPLSGDHFRVSDRRQHFFLPSRTLFFFRPDLYVRLQSYSHPRPQVRRMAPYLNNRRASYSLPAGEPRVYRSVTLAFPPSEMVRANTSDLIFQVSPSKALVYIDGRLIGSAGDFSTQKTRYSLVDGQHALKIAFPGYQTFETEMEVVANRTLNLAVELESLPPDR